MYILRTNFNYIFMTSEMLLELGYPSVHDLVGRRFEISYKEFIKGKYEIVTRKKELISLEFFHETEKVNHFIFYDGYNQIKIPYIHLLEIKKI